MKEGKFQDLALDFAKYFYKILNLNKCRLPCKKFQNIVNFRNLAGGGSLRLEQYYKFRLNLNSILINI